MLTYRASHPRGYGSVRQARRDLLEFAATCGFYGVTLYDVENAAGEALANAAEHGDCSTSAGFDVDATFDGERLVIEVQDHGSGFDAATTPRSAPPDASNRGFGIYLMRLLMDEVAYSDHGSRIRLVKRLDERPAAS